MSLSKAVKDHVDCLHLISNFIQCFFSDSTIKWGKWTPFLLIFSNYEQKIVRNCKESCCKQIQVLLLEMHHDLEIERIFLQSIECFYIHKVPLLKLDVISGQKLASKIMRSGCSVQFSAEIHRIYLFGPSCLWWSLSTLGPKESK